MTRPTDDELEAQACKHDHAATDPMLDNVTAVKRQLIIRRDKQTAAMLRACKSHDQPKPPADRAEAAARILDWFPAYPCHPAWDALIEKAEEGADEDDCVRAWLTALEAEKPRSDAMLRYGNEQEARIEALTAALAAEKAESAKLQKGWSLAVDQCDKEYARAEAAEAKLKKAAETHDALLDACQQTHKDGGRELAKLVFEHCAALRDMDATQG